MDCYLVHVSAYELLHSQCDLLWTATWSVCLHMDCYIVNVTSYGLNGLLLGPCDCLWTATWSM